MIFWVENNKKFTFNQFLKDLNSGLNHISYPGYNYFLNLLKSIIKDHTIRSLEEIIKIVKFKNEKLFFNIETSGTTSKPKKIRVSLKNCIRYVKYSSDSDNVKVWGMGYPAGSYASTQVFFQAFMNMEPIIYLFGADFSKVSDIISLYKVTNLSCTPTFLSMLIINTSTNNGTLKKVTTGGEKIRDGLIFSLKKFYKNAEYINIYASTETGSLLYSNSEYFSIPEKYKNLLKIKKNTLHVHKDLLNSSSSLKLKSEWYNTNDVVEWNDDAEFRFISRDNGYLNTGGYRVYPNEIEIELLKINGVEDVHVYGKKNSILGTIICADILTKKITPKVVKYELSKSLEKHKVPQIIRIVNNFEYVKNGKKIIMV